MSQFLGTLLLVFLLSTVTFIFCEIKEAAKVKREFSPWQNFSYGFIAYSVIMLLIWGFKLAFILIF